MPSNLGNPNDINILFVDRIQGINQPNINILSKYANVTDADGVSILIIQLCCPLLVPFIVHVVNTCPLESVFPNACKEALVKPIAKTNSPKSLTDIRPISILPVLSKVLEKIINFQISDHLLITYYRITILGSALIIVVVLHCLKLLMTYFMLQIIEI